MTHLVDTTIKTKKMLKECAEDFNRTGDESHDLWFEDPSMFAPRDWGFSTLQEGEEFTCTNHPKRSWFAQVGKKNGKIWVK